MRILRIPRIPLYDEWQAVDAEKRAAILQWSKIMGIIAIPFIIPVYFFFNYSVLGIVPLGRLADAAYEETGVLAGVVTLTPACFGKECEGVEERYSGRSIVIRGEGEEAPVLLPLTSNGAFEGRVPIGTHSIALTQCSFVGCRTAFPQTVTIRPGRTTVIDIPIEIYKPIQK